MKLFNRLILSMVESLPKPLVKRFALRYIAGERLSDAVRVVRELNSRGMMGTIDVLGENVSTQDESLGAAREFEEVLHSIDRNHLEANLSIKLTQFGLKIDQEFCYSNVRRLLQIASGYGRFVRIDMEDSSTTNDTLALYRRIRSAGFENAGVVIQANMRRSEEDVRGLIPMKANIRLCKGAYVEPDPVAFQEKEEVRQNFVRLLEILLGAKCYVGIATHDDFLIRRAYHLTHEMDLPNSAYEFQMLYGVRAGLRERIVKDGHRLRVYVPFGEQWYPYSIRRFKENPQIIRYVLRAIISGS